MKAEQITEPDAEHGEGPVWSPSWGGLRWVDTFDGDLYTLGALLYWSLTGKNMPTLFTLKSIDRLTRQS